MERVVGEVFDFEGTMLRVKDTGRETSCNGCYLDESEHECCDKPNPDCIGHCYGPERSDGKNVIFVEVKQ